MTGQFSRAFSDSKLTFVLCRERLRVSGVASASPCTWRAEPTSREHGCASAARKTVPTAASSFLSAMASALAIAARPVDCWSSSPLPLSVWGTRRASECLRSGDT
eukprot:4006796-Pleurochrysis_carterae.AAC.1